MPFSNGNAFAFQPSDITIISLAEGKQAIPPRDYFSYFAVHEMRSFISIGKPYATFFTPPFIASSSLRPFSVLTKTHCRFHPLFTTSSSLRTAPSTRPISIISLYKMSQKQFSNTDVPGDKPADPYKATNLTEPDLKEKVQDLVSFMESCKFGMMTTRIESSGLLTSRCMALAAKVRSYNPGSRYRQQLGMEANTRSLYRKVVASISSSIPTPSPAKPTTLRTTQRSTSPSSIRPANGLLSPVKPKLLQIARWFVNTTPQP